ncbi:MAG: hypothetical protein COA78_05825 [Blastopirellula sp.]|nr:MAG: hypothetical protein COA78_05825 [Blastopirellula sp.]
MPERSLKNSTLLGHFNFTVQNALISGSTADDSGVGCASGSTVFGTSSVWPQAIRGYSGQDSSITISTGSVSFEVARVLISDGRNVLQKYFSRQGAKAPRGSASNFLGALA